VAKFSDYVSNILFAESEHDDGYDEKKLSPYALKWAMMTQREKERYE